MGWRKQFELRNERIEYIRNLLRERTKSGKDYFIQELVNETRIPRSTVERYLYEYLEKEIEIYYEGPLKKIKFVGILASPQGIECLHNAHPDVPIHIAAIDEGLNEHGYILPGLGDAGDRQFGT